MTLASIPNLLKSSCLLLWPAVEGGEAVQPDRASGSEWRTEMGIETSVIVIRNSRNSQFPTTPSLTSVSVKRASVWNGGVPRRSSTGARISLTPCQG